MSHPKEHWTPVQAACHNLIHDFEFNGKRGASAWAEIRGGSPNAISNKANPDYSQAKYGIEEVIEDEIQAGIFPALHAHARMTGHICLRLPDPDLVVGDVSLLERYSAWQSDMGKTCEEIHQAVSPDSPGGADVIPAEIEAIAAAGYRHIKQFIVFLEEMKLIQEPA